MELNLTDPQRNKQLRMVLFFILLYVNQYDHIVLNLMMILKRDTFSSMGYASEIEATAASLTNQRVVNQFTSIAKRGLASS